MNLSFSARGWKSLSWADMIQDAEEYGFQGIELYDLIQFPSFTDKNGSFHKYHQNETLRDLRRRGLEIPCIDTPIDFSQEQLPLDHLRVLMDTAAAMHIPAIAVCALQDH